MLSITLSLHTIVLPFIESRHYGMNQHFKERSNMLGLSALVKDTNAFLGSVEIEASEPNNKFLEKEIASVRKYLRLKVNAVEERLPRFGGQVEGQPSSQAFS